MNTAEQTISTNPDYMGTTPPVVIKRIVNSKGTNHEIRVDSTATNADVDNTIAVLEYAEHQLQTKGLI